MTKTNKAKVFTTLKTLTFMLALSMTATAYGQALVLDGNSFGRHGGGNAQSVDRSRIIELLKTRQVEPVANYAPATPIGRLSDYIGYLDILNADDTSPKCTGALIAADLVLTNAHCVAERGQNRATHVTFTLGYTSLHTSEGERVFNASPRPVERGDPRGLDYAILRLNNPVPGFRDPGFLYRDPQSTEQLLILGHPLGDPLYVARGGCQAHRQYPVHNNGYRVSHHCDTLEGNSGSLIFASDLRTVVGLHNAGGNGANLGIRMSALLETSPILRRVFASVASDENTSQLSCVDIQIPEGFICRSGTNGRLEVFSFGAASTGQNHSTFIEDEYGGGILSNDRSGSPNLALAAGQNWIQIAGEVTLRSAEDTFRRIKKDFENVRLFHLPNNGWYVIRLGPYTQTDAENARKALRGAGAIPRDSFITLSASYETELVVLSPTPSP